MQNIAIGADHAGFDLKQMIAEHLKSRGLEVADCGVHSGQEPADYPTVARVVALRVAGGESCMGIIIDGAGIGSSMVANKVPGVRAALCYDVSSANNAREHNDANVLTLGSRMIGSALALQIVDRFLDTQCTAERHLRRVAMIEPTSTTIAAPAEATCEMCNPSAPTVDGGQDVSEADLQRIADRIATMMASGPAAAGEGAEIWSQIACGFCRTCAEIDPELVRSFIEMGADRIVHRGDGDAIPQDVARYIDHTLLRPDATYEQVDKLCQEAAEFGFASVCVNPCHVQRCAKALRGSRVAVCTVVGFPLGATTTEAKAAETRQAIRQGAKEIDMVINVGALKSGDDDLVYHDIRKVVESCMDGGALCKVILETALLTDDEKTRACLAARRARADFVKTSTGFGPGGATAEDVALMRDAVKGTHMGVKASGGIRSYKDAQQMIRAGATRIGASAGVRIVKESKGATFSDSKSNKY